MLLFFNTSVFVGCCFVIFQTCCYLFVDDFKMYWRERICSVPPLKWMQFKVQKVPMFWVHPNARQTFKLNASNFIISFTIWINPMNVRCVGRQACTWCTISNDMQIIMMVESSASNHETVNVKRQQWRCDHRHQLWC